MIDKNGKHVPFGDPNRRRISETEWLCDKCKIVFCSVDELDYHCDNGHTPPPPAPPESPGWSSPEKDYMPTKRKVRQPSKTPYTRTWPLPRSAHEPSFLRRIFNRLGK